MSEFRPATPYNVPALLIPTEYEKVNGITVKKPYYSIKMSVFSGVRMITVYRDGVLNTDPLWIKTKYRSPSAEDWTEGVTRSITESYVSSYTTNGITYQVGIYSDRDATVLLAEATARDGQEVDTAFGNLIFVSAKSYGGTEKVINDKYVIMDTLSVETWYRPDIHGSDCVRLLDDGSLWEILNTPEDIDRRHQFLKFKVQRVKGGA